MIEYRWVGHHCKVVVGGLVLAFINERNGEFELHFPQEVTLRSRKANNLPDLDAYLQGHFCTTSGGTR